MLLRSRLSLLAIVCCEIDQALTYQTVRTNEGHDFESPELRVVEEEESEAVAEVEETTEEESELVVEEPQAENPKKGAGQAELLLEGGPKGRFQGEQPNVIEGEDLDVPPYLRKKRRNR